MRTAALLLAFVVFSAPAARAALVCNGGSFDVSGLPLVVAGAGNTEALLVGHSGTSITLTHYAGLSTTYGCPLVFGRARAKGDGSAIVVRGAWKTCGPVLGPHRVT